VPAKRRGQRLHPSDAESIGLMLRSDAWQLFQQRIERAMFLKAEELLQPLDPVKTATVRGEVAGLKLALKVPEILMTEASANRAAGGDDHGKVDSSGA